MRFFIDNNLSHRIAKALDLLDDENEIIHIRDKYHESAKDPDWIPALGAEGGWIVISCDLGIKRDHHLLKALKESGLTIFFITANWKDHNFWDISWRLIKRWPKITEQAARFPDHAMFQVSIKSTEFRRL